MAHPRFFLSESLPMAVDVQVELPLGKDDLHHAVDVLRLTEAETIVAVEPSGRALLVRIDSVERGGIRGTVLGEAKRPFEPRLTLVQGVSKGERMDLTVRMAVELGVERIVPVITERCIVRLDAKKGAEKSARWSRIALAAAKQAGRSAIPQVDEPCRLTEVAAAICETHELVMVAWEDADGGRIAEAVASASCTPESRVAVVVGPEGGLTQAEVEAFTSSGAALVTLGDTVLRTETAAVVACALAVDGLGRAGGPRP